MFGRLASLFVDIEAKTTGIDAGLAKTKSELSGLAVLGAAAFAAVGASAVYGAYKAVNAASDLNEALSKTDAIFKDSSQAVKTFADQMARDFGFVKRETLDANAAFAGLAKEIGGLQGAGLTDFTTKFTKLAADMSSFHNISFEEAATALRSGLSGEIEPLKKYGVVVDETAVKNFAYANSMAKVGTELTQQQKLMARSALIMRMTGDMQGDLERTSSGFANQSRKLWGTFQNTLAEVGAILMPIAERVLGALNAVSGAISGFLAEHGDTLTGWAEAVGSAIDWVIATISEVAAAVADSGAQLAAEVQNWDLYRGAVAALGTAWAWLRDTASAVFATIGVIYRNFGTFAAIAFITGKQYVINMGEAISWFVDAAGQYLQWFGRNWVQVFSDAFNAALTIVKNFASNVWSNLKALWDWVASGFTSELNLSWTPLLDGFEATMEKLPDIAGPTFSNLQGEIDALGEQMAEAEGKRADAAGKAAVQVKSTTGKIADDKKKSDDGVMKKAVESKFVGIEQMAKDIQAAALGKGGDAKRTADNTEKMLAEQKATRKAIEGKAKEPARAGR